MVSQRATKNMSTTLEFSQQELNQQDESAQGSLAQGSLAQGSQTGVGYHIKSRTKQRGCFGRKNGKGLKYIARKNGRSHVWNGRKYITNKIGRNHPFFFKKIRAAKKSLRNKAVKDKSKEDRKEMSGIEYDRFWELSFLEAMEKEKQHHIEIENTQTRSRTQYHHQLLMRELADVSEKMKEATSRRTDRLIKAFVADNKLWYEMTSAQMLRQAGREANRYVSQLVLDQEKNGVEYTGEYCR